MNIAKSLMTGAAAALVVATLPASAAETRVNPASRLLLVGAQGASEVPPKHNDDDCVRRAGNDRDWWWYNTQADKWIECADKAAGANPGGNLGLIIAGIAVLGGLGAGLAGGGGGPASP